jgi:Protein of unknown function with HXXEE motif
MIMVNQWFMRNWMYAGFIAGLFLFAIAPLLVGGWSLPLLLVFLQLPMYMMHQLEEHAGDRFRTFINAKMAKTPDALTTAAVIVINVPLVWGVDLVALYLADFVALGLGLIAVYLSVVNAVIHLAAAGRFGYNPGLATGVFLFLPVGIWTIVVFAQTPGVGIGYHALALAIAIGVHIGIAVHVMRRAKQLNAAAAHPA